MLEKEAWLREANDKRRLADLLHTIRSGGNFRDEAFEEIAKLVQRFGIEIPDIPASVGGKARVFLYMYPSFMDDLLGYLREVTGHTYGEMKPYYAVADSLRTWALQTVEKIADVANQWDLHQYVTEADLKELGEKMSEWREIMKETPPPKPPDPTVDDLPFISQEYLAQDSIDLPGWLSAHVPARGT